MQDPISDFLNALKMASRTGKESFAFPASRYIFAVAEALLKAGYVASVVKKGKKNHSIEIKLLYQNDKPKITEVKRISLPSRRVYKAARDIREVRSGFGSMFLSTSKGILINKEARSARVGGEALFEIW